MVRFSRLINVLRSEESYHIEWQWHNRDIYYIFINEVHGAAQVVGSGNGDSEPGARQDEVN